MGFTSQQGQVGFGLQSVKGTPVAATRFARLRSGALAPNRDLLIPDPEIGGNRDVPQAYLGPISYSGSYDFYARLELLSLLFRGAFGAVTSTTEAGSAEVQTVTINGAPTGGTFTLTFRGQTTAPIAYNADGVAVQTALEALSTIGAGNVTVAGAIGGPHTVTFAGVLAVGDMRPITGNAGELTGGVNPSVTVTETTPGGATAGTHVLVPSDASSLPWLSVEERISVDYESFRYTDAKVSRLHLECDATGYMMGTVDLAALTQESAFVAQANPPVDTSPMIVGSQILVYWNGALLPAKSFNFEVNNNMENDDFRLGSFVLGDLTEKRREFTMGATIRPNDAAMWREATYGGADLTGPRAGRASYGTLSVVASTFENVQAGAPYSIRIDVPTAAVAPFQIGPSGDDVIQHDISFTLLRDDPIVPIATVTITDDLATVS